MMLTSAGIFAPQKTPRFILFLCFRPVPYRSCFRRRSFTITFILPKFSGISKKIPTPNTLPPASSAKYGKPFELIVVGDSDMLYDSFWTVHQTILENNYAIPVLDNANFVLNALDTLLGRDDMINLRGKSGKTVLSKISKPLANWHSSSSKSAKKTSLIKLNKPNPAFKKFGAKKL